MVCEDYKVSHGRSSHSDAADRLWCILHAEALWTKCTERRLTNDPTARGCGKAATAFLDAQPESVRWEEWMARIAPGGEVIRAPSCMFTS
jgi:hypothetical protein